MAFLAEYGLFLAQVVTLVIAVIFVVGSIVSLISRSRGNDNKSGERIKLTHLNDTLKNYQETFDDALLDKETLKTRDKQQKKQDKQDRKARKKGTQEPPKPRVFVLDFDGDINASETEQLREEITAVLAVAKPQDEIVVRLESPGGVVHDYGLASSQLDRIIKRQIPLTVCVDKMAASGGYMMACVANKIIAAPFAAIGSIGVAAQMPNLHRLLKKNDVDYEVLTAGEYKRTLTVLGENTEKGRQKFLDDLEDIHQLFKGYVAEHRPQLDIQDVATGEYWYGIRALEKKLVDELQTSDDYLIAACDRAEVYQVTKHQKQSLQDRLGLSVEKTADRLLLRWYQRFNNGFKFQ